MTLVAEIAPTQEISHGSFLQELARKKVGVVVPSYNEEIKIAATLREIPPYVTRVYVIDDASTDASVASVERARAADPRIELIRHEANKGVGAAISTGYLRAIDDDMDIAVVMAGDGQMDPADLPALLRPMLRGQADYVKGNRFFHPSGISEIPRHRFFGNVVLSILTKIVAGYWHVSDTQCGYTAIGRRALAAVDWKAIYPRYGCPNDILTKLNVANMRVAEVPVKARYGAEWASKLRAHRVALPILALLWRLFRYRTYYKYIVMNGHPIVMFYFFGFLAFFASVILFIYVATKFAITGIVPQAALIMFGIALGVTLQLLLGAFSLDYQANQKLMIDLSDQDPTRS